jgi:hypothetical protein
MVPCQSRNQPASLKTEIGFATMGEFGRLPHIEAFGHGQKRFPADKLGNLSYRALS